MITAVKQYLNAIFMYIYLIYYTERLRRDTKFMFREAAKEIKNNHQNTLKKLAAYEREHLWRI